MRLKNDGRHLDKINDEKELSLKRKKAKNDEFLSKMMDIW
jgi:hypothetical protein